MGRSKIQFKIGHFWKNGVYSSSEINALNEPYNINIILRQNPQNAILKTMRNHIILKGYSVAYSHFMRKEYQHCLEKIVDAPGPMITMSDADTVEVNKHFPLPIPSIISSAATIATIVPFLKSS